MSQTNRFMFERILFLLCYPDTTEKEFIAKFEVNRRTFYRDKEFIKDRLFMYEVKIKGND